MHKYYFVAYFLFFVWQYVRWKLKDKLDTFIHFCFFSRVRVYTKKACKSRNFFHMGLPLGFLLHHNNATMQYSINNKKTKKTEVSKKVILVDQKMKKSWNKKFTPFLFCEHFGTILMGAARGGGLNRLNGHL